MKMKLGHKQVSPIFNLCIGVETITKAAEWPVEIVQSYPVWSVSRQTCTSLDLTYRPGHTTAEFNESSFS